MKLYLADMPDCFGYGLCVIAPTEDEARLALEAAYKKMAKDYQCHMGFLEAMEYFGGTVRPITPGKAYNDGFRE